VEQTALQQKDKVKKQLLNFYAFYKVILLPFNGETKDV